MKTSIATLPRDAWRLAKPYFNSEERWIARTLLAAIIALNLAAVGMDVILNYWNRAFYNTLQTKDFDAFTNLLLFWHHTSETVYLLDFIPTNYLPGFMPIACLYIAVLVANRYLNQWLQIRWRAWMTGTMLSQWLSDRAYYRINLTSGAGGTDSNDNPDQRIAEDLKDYVDSTLSTSIDFLSNVVSLGSFIAILWGLSGALNLFGIDIPGYLVWVALIYAAIGTLCTHFIGRPLVGLRFHQQRVEADFRFSLARLRENMEAIALSGGEAAEKRGLQTRFAALRANWWDIMQRAKLLNIFINGYSQISVVFPFVVTAPRFFKGTLDLGGLTQTVGAFSSVQGSMSWFVTAYAGLANMRAVINRLISFQDAIDAARAHGRDGVSRGTADAAGYTLADATLRLPDGTPLLHDGNLTLTPGVSTVITGRSGSGKSTLFRALAGIWPFGTGQLRPGQGVSLFLPQRPYFPLGTLRDAITYPDEPGQFPDEALRTALDDVGLSHLIPRLEERDAWGLMLSGGEQQRLSLARALLIRPDWLFLDEATASLDPETELEVLTVLRARLPNTTLVSIAHRENVQAMHQARVVFERSEQGPGTLLTTP